MEVALYILAIWSFFASIAATHFYTSSRQFEARFKESQQNLEETNSYFDGEISHQRENLYKWQDFAVTKQGYDPLHSADKKQTPAPGELLPPFAEAAKEWEVEENKKPYANEADFDSEKLSTLLQDDTDEEL